MLQPIPGDPWGVEQHHWNTGTKENQQLNVFVLECERVKKQEYRKKKRKMDEVNEFIDLDETRKKRKNKFVDHRLEKTSDQSYFKDIRECIKQFHSRIAVGPLFICTCCHKHGLEKVFAC